MDFKKIGKVIHYFDKIKVAVARLEIGDLKTGDEIKIISREGIELHQKVKSMQIEHADIEIAKAGDEFGLKVDKVVKSGDLIFKLIE